MPPSKTERLILIVAILLSLAALALASASPSFFMDNKSVYQGF